jgi:hypothetical protein
MKLNPECVAQLIEIDGVLSKNAISKLIPLGCTDYSNYSDDPVKMTQIAKQIISIISEDFDKADGLKDGIIQKDIILNRTRILNEKKDYAGAYQEFLEIFKNPEIRALRVEQFEDIIPPLIREGLDQILSDRKPEAPMSRPSGSIAVT